jgi:hypothetical protein
MLENRYTIKIWQGATFGLTITVKDASGNTKNLENCTALMQIRPSYYSGGITETLSTANGEILISGNTGNVALALSAARTANIPVDMFDDHTPPRTKYVYDLDLKDSGNNVTKLIYGEVYVYGEVTR